MSFCSSLRASSSVVFSAVSSGFSFISVSLVSSDISVVSSWVESLCFSIIDSSICSAVSVSSFIRVSEFTSVDFDNSCSISLGASLSIASRIILTYFSCASAEEYDVGIQFLGVIGVNLLTTGRLNCGFGSSSNFLFLSKTLAYNLFLASNWHFDLNTISALSSIDKSLNSKVSSFAFFSAKTMSAFLAILSWSSMLTCLNFSFSLAFLSSKSFVRETLFKYLAFSSRFPILSSNHFITASLLGFLSLGVSSAINSAKVSIIFSSFKISSNLANDGRRVRILSAILS